jgi:hypothetical protein
LPLFRRGRLVESYELVLSVHSLSWDVAKGTISYSFRLEVKHSDAIVSLNRGLEVSSVKGCSRVRIRKHVESDLGWATLTVLELRGVKGYVEASVAGSPEDFTLSRLGVRFGRVLLKDELVWHPIPSKHLVSWGTRGHVVSFKIHVKAKPSRVVAPGSVEQVEDGTLFAGRPRTRTPGITVVGDVDVSDYKEFRIARPPSCPVSVSEAGRLLEYMNTVAAEVASTLSRPAPSYRTVLVLWDDVDPFTCDDLAAIRASVARSVAKRSAHALHELFHVAAVHLTYNSRLDSLTDYWLYETIPGTLALYILWRYGRDLIEPAKRRLEECLAAVGKDVPPPAKVSIPRRPRDHASISRLGPLMLWRLAELYGVEALEAVLSCTLAQNISSARFRSCLDEVLGADRARRLYDSLLHSRSI